MEYMPRFESRLGLSSFDGVDLVTDVILLANDELIVASDQGQSLSFCKISKSSGNWFPGILVRVNVMNGYQFAKIKKVIKVGSEVKLIEFDSNWDYKLSHPVFPGSKIEKFVGYNNGFIDRIVQESTQYINRMTKKLGRPPALSELKVYM